MKHVKTLLNYTTTFDQQTISDDFIDLWQSVEFPENKECYGLYFNYQDNGNLYDFAIVTTTSNSDTPF